jgi:hypothetical protein
MKKIFTVVTILLAVQHYKAQTVLTNAIIKGKVETQIETDNENPGFMMRSPGASTLTVYIKDSLSKVTTTTDFFINTVIANTNSQETIICNESQGEKTAYKTTPADRADQKKKTDSVMKEMANGGGSAMPGRMTLRMGGNTTVKEITYTTDAKTINNINCKKAVITQQDDEGKVTTIDVWYTEDYELPKGVSLGRTVPNFGDLTGMPVQFVTTRKMEMNGNTTSFISTFTIESIDTKATIVETDLTVPKGYKVKTYAEWIKDNPQGQSPVRMIMRAG